MHRFYLSPSECVGTEIIMRGREAHHAIDVLRLKQGERLTILDGQGHDLLCEVASVGKQFLTASVIQKNVVAALPWQITLLQAIPKGKTMEAIIQKATELGVSRVIPLISERVISQLDDEDALLRQAKWQQVAVEAIKQCGQPWLPLVEAPLTPKAYLSRNERFDLPLVASLQDDRHHPRVAFKDFESEHKTSLKTLSIWIGPEGDFTPSEMSAIKTSGAVPISLGRLILRSDTAAIYALSVINYELQAG